MMFYIAGGQVTRTHTHLKYGLFSTTTQILNHSLLCKGIQKPILGLFGFCDSDPSVVCLSTEFLFFTVSMDFTFFPATPHFDALLLCLFSCSSLCLLLHGKTFSTSHVHFSSYSSTLSSNHTHSRAYSSRSCRGFMNHSRFFRTKYRYMIPNNDSVYSITFSLIMFRSMKARRFSTLDAKRRKKLNRCHLSTLVTTLTFGNASAIGPYKLTIARKIVPLMLKRALRSPLSVKKLSTSRNMSNSATLATRNRYE
mmetsp:Transcript_38837/g.93435  ORF Transcript_38837/g.93435 Transcript_38837/m.93435 type:complete len:253 (-) Transcript_38837:357-1115(-)